MKIGFFFIAFSVTILMVFYVSLRGWQALQSVGTARIWYLAANIVLFLTMLIGLMSRGALPPTIGKVVTFVGFTYMIVMIYLLLSFLLVDIVRLANYFIHFAPAGMKVFRLWALVSTLGVVTIAMIIGNYKFNHPAIVNLSIKVEKPEQNKTLKIVAASDIHLGPSIDKSRLKKYVELINAQKPDIVLLAGDIADNATKPLIDQNMAEELHNIKTTQGVYAITGNHEYYGENPYATEAYLKSAGITYLRDSSVLVNNSFYIVGRDDKSNLKRKSLKQIMNGIDKSKPIILLDHQPFNLEEAQVNDVDLQISGHTHNGQFFPGNLIVKLMYEKAYGYMQKGKTHYYISSGLGLWGPQYRIGTQSELVVIDLKY
jgi:uncharacterized protein